MSDTAQFTGRASAAEREMRTAVVERLRASLPDARIIHELVCGECRADLAAVEPERVLLIELKSENDKLDRCEDQMRAFASCSHRAILVAHLRFFDRTPYTNGSPRLNWPLPEVSHDVWCYPAPDSTISSYPEMYAWRLPQPSRWQPPARKLLDLLWRDELVAECAAHRIGVTRRTTMVQMIDEMCWLMTGREIVRAACRQLRLRKFPTADDPIAEPRA